MEAVVRMLRRSPVLVCALSGLAVVALTAMLGLHFAAAATVTPAVASIATPPMGWASWNSFAAQINYNVIKAQTDALVSSGMKDAGYEYVNIDEGWWQGAPATPPATSRWTPATGRVG